MLQKRRPDELAAGTIKNRRALASCTCVNNGKSWRAVCNVFDVKIERLVKILKREREIDRLDERT